MINSRIKGKSPLGKPEEKAGEKIITSILYNAFEESGEEFVEYAADFLLDGAARAYANYMEDAYRLQSDRS